MGGTKVGRSIDALLQLMAALRNPQSGCPWDLEQSFASIAPYTLEEAYEVADAIERGEWGELRGELGDLLFQVVFHARMAEEQGLFNFQDVVDAIVEKMIRRHPHVFADQSVADATEQTQAWEQHKKQERRAQGKSQGTLDGVTLGLPALSRAEKLQRSAARCGFDWTSIGPVLEKLEEELAELREALGEESVSKRHEEIGDLLFSCVNLARHAGVDAEQALRGANNKFVRRFQYIERQLQDSDESMEKQSAERLDALWQEAKAALRD